MASFSMNSNDCESPRNFSRPFPSPPSSCAFSDEAILTSINVEENPELAQSVQRVVTVLHPPLPKKLRKRQVRNMLGEVSPKSNPLDQIREPLPVPSTEPKPIALTRSLSNNANSDMRMRAFKGFTSRPSSSHGSHSNDSSSGGRRRLSKDRHLSVKPRHVVSDADLRRKTQVTSTLTVSAEDILEPGSDKPILHFRAYLWRYLDRDRKTLNLDLFWPQNLDEDPSSELDDNDEAGDVFALEDMRPLLEFRHLKSLKLGGMLVSYQKSIWMACWLNPGLEELFLEMALEPEIRRECRPLWPKIEKDWEVRRATEGSTTYL